MYTLDDLQNDVFELRAQHIDILSAENKALIDRNHAINDVISKAFTGSIVTAEIMRKVMTLENVSTIIEANTKLASGEIDNRGFLVRCALGYDELLGKIARIILFDTRWYERRIGELSVQPNNPLLCLPDDEIAACISEIFAKATVEELSQIRDDIEALITAAKKAPTPKRGANGRFVKPR